MKIHILGVGGTAMSAVAQIFVRMGLGVSGSDQAWSETMDDLVNIGLNVWAPHNPAKVDSSTDLVAVSAAITADNEELQVFAQLGIPVVSRAEVMASLGSLRDTFAISGTAGKTTTSAMLATIALDCGWDPSFIVGSKVHGLGTGARWGDSRAFVVEADESDGSFLRFGAQHVIVNSIEDDHLDFWGNSVELQAGFDLFVSNAHRTRLVCGDDPGCSQLIERLTGPNSTHQLAGTPISKFGFAQDCDYRIVDFVADRLTSRFTVRYGATKQHLHLIVPGRHNALNATAAFAMAISNGVNPELAVSSLERFRGAARRFEFRGEYGGITYVDDYAHLPAKARAAVDAGLLGGFGRVVVVYQPHRYTRTRDLWSQYKGAFTGADVVVVTGIYPAGQSPLPGISGKLIADDVASANPNLRVVYVENRAEVAEVVGALLSPGDLCLTLNAGDLTALPDELMASAKGGS